MDYQDFLKSKTLKYDAVGFEVSVDDLNPMLFDWQKVLVRWALYKGRAALFADCGLGKGQPPNSLILTPNGFVCLKDLTIGDLVISSNGRAYPVRGIYPRGMQQTYHVWFNDHTSITVDADHLHICRTNNDRQRNKKWRVLSTRELLMTDLRYGTGGKSRNYDIPIVAPVYFNQTLFVYMWTPYAIGTLLGDGGLSTNDIIISSSDREIIDRINTELPLGCIFKHKTKYDYRLHTGLTGSRRHPLRDILHKLGLIGCKAGLRFQGAGLGR